MIRATVVTEGTSDRVLIPILRWLLEELITAPIDVTWADLRGQHAHETSLAEKLRLAVELYPCELLFVHRDRDRASHADRHHEIEQALVTARLSTLINEELVHEELVNEELGLAQPVPVIPMRMQEAWLLHDEAALRRAVGRPSGREPLNLPKIHRIEDLSDPKTVLHDALRHASDTRGRRRRAFRAERAAHRLAGLINDWSPLRQLSAFRQLEEDTRDALARLGVEFSP